MTEPLATQSPSGSDSGVAPRRAVVMQRMMTRRSRRIYGKVLLFLFATAVMVVFALVNRDAQQFRRSAQDAQELADLLQSRYADRALPAMMPMPPGLDDTHREARRGNYIYRGQAARREALLSNSLRAIVYPELPLALYLRADGRHVVLSNGFEYQVRWVTETERTGAAAEWRIDVIEYP